MPDRRLKVLIVAAEVAPFAKVGGLADVAGALPKALHALGHDVRVAMPAYAMVESDPRTQVEDLLPAFPVPVRPGVVQTAYARQTRIGPNVPLYLVGGSPAFAAATESRKLYTLEPDPYIFFARAVAEMVPRLSPAWTPDVVHCNDWHTGLLPVYLEQTYADHPAWRGAARVFTIHNLAYQGTFDPTVLQKAGLPASLFHYQALEFYGQMSFMKGGLVFSDRVNTVSRTYAQEIQTAEYGCRLEGLLQYLASLGRLSGILNGIDYEEYDPATDPRIAARYSADQPEGKGLCKAALQAECGLPTDESAAVIGIVSRLADQKGFDLIHDAAERMLDLPIQLVLLGTGDARYEAYFRALEQRFPRQVRAHIGFDAALAQRIYAGCDMFLMPSRFEPCGLGQLMSLRYGTIPVVRATGGLADTVSDSTAHPQTGNGFVFVNYGADALLDAVRRAVSAYQDRDAWGALVGRALRADFSWTASARDYACLYEQAVAARRSAA